MYAAPTCGGTLARDPAGFRTDGANLESGLTRDLRFEAFEKRARQLRGAAAAATGQADPITICNWMATGGTAHWQLFVNTTDETHVRQYKTANELHLGLNGSERRSKGGAKNRGNVPCEQEGLLKSNSKDCNSVADACGWRQTF
jgi:hypothetical protein